MGDATDPYALSLQDEGFLPQPLVPTPSFVKCPPYDPRTLKYIYIAKLVNKISSQKMPYPRLWMVTPAFSVLCEPAKADVRRIIRLGDIEKVFVQEVDGGPRPGMVRLIVKPKPNVPEPTCIIELSEEDNPREALRILDALRRPQSGGDKLSIQTILPSEDVHANPDVYGSLDKRVHPSYTDPQQKLKKWHASDQPPSHWHRKWEQQEAGSAQEGSSGPSPADPGAPAAPAGGGDEDAAPPPPPVPLASAPATSWPGASSPSPAGSGAQGAGGGGFAAPLPSGPPPSQAAPSDPPAAAVAVAPPPPPPPGGGRPSRGSFASIAVAEAGGGLVSPRGGGGGAAEEDVLFERAQRDAAERRADRAEAAANALAQQLSRAAQQEASNLKVTHLRTEGLDSAVSACKICKEPLAPFCSTTGLEHTSGKVIVTMITSRMTQHADAVSRAGAAEFPVSGWNPFPILTDRDILFSVVSGGVLLGKTGVLVRDAMPPGQSSMPAALWDQGIVVKLDGVRTGLLRIRGRSCDQFGDEKHIGNVVYTCTPAYGSSHPLHDLPGGHPVSTVPRGAPVVVEETTQHDGETWGRVEDKWVIIRDARGVHHLTAKGRNQDDMLRRMVAAAVAAAAVSAHLTSLLRGTGLESVSREVEQLRSDIQTLESETLLRHAALGLVERQASGRSLREGHQQQQQQQHRFDAVADYDNFEQFEPLTRPAVAVSAAPPPEQNRTPAGGGAHQQQQQHRHAASPGVSSPDAAHSFRYPSLSPAPTPGGSGVPPAAPGWERGAEQQQQGQPQRWTPQAEALPLTHTGSGRVAPRPHPMGGRWGAAGGGGDPRDGLMCIASPLLSDTPLFVGGGGGGGAPQQIYPGRCVSPPGRDPSRHGEAYLNMSRPMGAGGAAHSQHQSHALPSSGGVHPGAPGGSDVIVVRVSQAGSSSSGSSSAAPMWGAPQSPMVGSRIMQSGVPVPVPWKGDRFSL